ncbi:MAG: RDD family protein [Acidobacteriota bacterium]
MSDRSVYGLDNVRIELPIAGAGSRALAATIDYSIWSLLVLVLISAASAGAVLFSDALPETGWLVALLALSLFALDFSFFFGQEALLQGQTLGKRLLGLRVVSHRGGRASLFAYVLRSLVRTFDLLFGAWFLIFDGRSRRIGDHLAGTIVVHEPKESSSGNAVRRAPAGWGAERIAVVETLFERYETLPPDRTEALSHRILVEAERAQPGFSDSSGSTWTLRLLRSFGTPEEPKVME